MRQHINKIPTPMCGLALAIASLGWCLENALPTGGLAKLTGAVIASVIIASITLKFTLSPNLLLQEIKHPVVGSVIPTSAMATMVISHEVGHHSSLTADIIWLGAVAFHILAFLLFTFYRLRHFQIQHMVPSWFIPPIGMVVADVSFSGTAVLEPVANAILIFGVAAYALMLPIMLYRLIFVGPLADGVKPTLAVMAAPASLCLAGYMTIVADVNTLLVFGLLAIALSMTLTVYLALFGLLRLPFSPGFAAFTFPMVIGATALFKASDWMTANSVYSQSAIWLRQLAMAELVVASLVVGYVSFHYIRYLYGQWKPCAVSLAAEI